MDRLLTEDEQNASWHVPGQLRAQDVKTLKAVAEKLEKIVTYTGCNEPHGEYTIFLDDYERLLVSLKWGNLPE